MKTILASILACACVAPAMATPRATSSSTNSNQINIDQNYQPPAPNIVGPVPRGSVPVLSIYGQMDGYQRPVYGAQISIPLAR